MKNTVLITGANRGIGYEFVKQYAQDGWQVIATCRDLEKSKKLTHLKDEFPHIQIFKLDVTFREETHALAKKLTNDPIDHLINNAGIGGISGQSFGSIDFDNMLHVYQTNAIGPLNVSEAFVEHLAQSHHKLIITISSRMGSIDDNQIGHAYAYRASKAALNMIMKNVAIDLQKRDIKVLLLHPGWVKTRLGGDEAKIPPEESVQRMRKIIAAHGPNAHADFYSHDGQRIPW